MKTFVPVVPHEWDYHLHTVVLMRELEQQLHNGNEYHLLVEDDYLFSDNALSTMRGLDLWEGFSVPYDYPDRYKTPEATVVVLGPSCHWRRINSVTMTIGAKAVLWRQVMPLMHEAAPTSNDKVFDDLLQKIPCLSPIPGVATHLTAHHHTPFFNVEERWNQLLIL